MAHLCVDLCAFTEPRSSGLETGFGLLQRLLLMGYIKLL